MLRSGGARSALAIALTAAMASGPIASQDSPAQHPRFDVPPAPDTIIISWDIRVPGIEWDDSTPRLRVYADGRVVVHYPVFMKKAGDYEAKLSRSELETLLTRLATYGVFTSDTEAIAAALRQKQRAEAAVKTPGRVVTVRSESPVSVIRIRLDGYAPSGGEKSGPIDRTITWVGLQADAAQHPDVSELAALAAAERELIAMLDRSDLAKIEGR